jgi:hypothetical protein
VRRAFSAVAALVLCLAGPVRGQSSGHSQGRWRAGVGIDLSVLSDRTRYGPAPWYGTRDAGLGVSVEGEVRVAEPLWAGIEAGESVDRDGNLFGAFGGLVLRSHGRVSVGLSAGVGVLARHDTPDDVVATGPAARLGLSPAVAAAGGTADGPGAAIRFGIGVDLPIAPLWSVTPSLHWMTSLGDYERALYGGGTLYRRRFREIRFGIALTRR